MSDGEFGEVQGCVENGVGISSEASLENKKTKGGEEII
jgi:hypothetical protein